MDEPTLHIHDDLFDFEDEEAEERALLKAEAQADAGMLISHDAVCRWLDTWGTGDEPPPPKCGE